MSSLSKNEIEQAAYRRGLREGYRSGLEASLAEDLRDRGVDFEFEPYKITYLQPEKIRRYLLDFQIERRTKPLLIETKGRFTTEDRKKHLLIKEQNPDMDLRFIFQNPNARLRKGSPTTYAMWCEKHGFKWAKKTVPEEWLNE